MYTKTYTKPDGAEVTEYYESWCGSAFGELYLAFAYTLVGLIGLICWPVRAVYLAFHPQCIGYGERNRVPFAKDKNHD